jgi:hypothetical protein
MRKLFLGSVLIFFLASAPVTFPQGSARREKVAEGHTWNGRRAFPVMDTAQSWTIWRTDDGFEVEDKLPEDKYELTKVSGQLRGEGPEKILVGQNSFALKNSS